MKRFGLGTSVAAVVATLSTLALLACTSEMPADADAPAIAEDALGEDYVGATWDGWTQSASGTYNVGAGNITYQSTFTRTSGPTTRGGGACYTIKQTGSTCTQDSNCNAAAVSTYGTGAVGYCYQSACYLRPGTQPVWCALGSQRTPGTVSRTVAGFPAPWTTGRHFILGCMTTNAGNPNGPSNCSLDEKTDLNTRIMTAVQRVEGCTVACAYETWDNYRCDYCTDSDCNGVAESCNGPDGQFIPGWMP